MSISDAIFQQLITLHKQGKASKCQYIKVEWAPGVTKYYAFARYSRVAQFRGVKKYTLGAHIEARILGDENDPFLKHEFQGDIRTKEVDIGFEDIDKEITNLFKQYGTVKMSIYEYYPQLDINERVWFGQLKPPKITGVKTVKTTASQGWRPRTAKIPKRLRGPECPHTYGGLFNTRFAQETGGCPVDLHLPGGTIGQIDPDTGQMYANCPRMTKADCNLRTGTTDGKYFGGWDTTLTAYVSDIHLGPVTGTSNIDRLEKPIIVTAGKKHREGLNLIGFAREPNSGHPDLGFIASLWEAGQGPVGDLYNLEVNGQRPNFNQWNTRLGDIGQSRTAWAGLTANLSGTALFFTRQGLGNPVGFGAQNLTAACDIVGYKKVAVFSDSDTYIRRGTDDRVWWLAELHTNQTIGQRYSKDEILIDRAIATSAHGRKTVTFTRNPPNGDPVTYTHRRTTFNANIDSRPFDELVVDICRSGGLFVPYQVDGQLAIDANRAFTEEELDAAIVCADHGPNKNIVWDDGEPAIQFSQIPPDELVNKIKASFEEESNKGRPRPIIVDDPDQAYRAGISRGEDVILEVADELTAYGISYRDETIKRSYEHLYFGQFAEGGIHNNARGVFFMDAFWAHGLKRYGPVVLDSALNTYESPDEDPFIYYRVLYLERAANNRVRVTVQAYNRQKMEAFEIESPDPPPSTVCTIDAQCPPGFVCRNGVCREIIIYGPPCRPEVGIVEYDTTAGEFRVPVEPC